MLMKIVYAALGFVGRIVSLFYLSVKEDHQTLVRFYYQGRMINFYG